jgi:N utilization substance protein A
MEALNVDEMVGQVLASEGFSSVEEVAYVESDEIASIDGFDEETAEEIQSRAREYLERVEAENDARRTELGVEDSLREIPGMTTAMMVAVGEDGVKSMEDFAGYAVDDIVGWKERKDGENKFHEGVLSSFGVTRPQAEEMVIVARLKVGWISEDDLATEEEEAEAGEGALASEEQA